ncbi:MAG: DUF3833 family protein [Hyphomonadaceae bacterium]|nr:DUF3833 family protein [Hyphomonadaceae bacterium]
MTKRAGLAALFALCAVTTACATRPPTPTDASTTAFVLERDLVGASVARGEFRAITGTRRAFTVELNGTWDGNVLTLVEDFAYEDGERDRKTWRLTRTAPGRFTGTREDVVGEAAGFVDGAVFRLEYDVILPSEDGRGRKVRFRDVLALNADGDVLNNATIGWFGLRVGSVSLVIERQD